MSEQENQKPRYIVGIDLGTTHSVVAYTAATPPADEQLRVELLPIAQVVAPNEIKAQPLLPSFLLMPGRTMYHREHWLCPGTTISTTPWAISPALVVPNFRRAWSHRRNPGCRTVASTVQRRFCPGTRPPMYSASRRSTPAHAISNTSEMPGTII